MIESPRRKADVDEIDALLEELTADGRARLRPGHGPGTGVDWGRMATFGLAAVGALAIMGAIVFGISRLLSDGGNGSASTATPPPSTSTPTTASPSTAPPSTGSASPATTAPPPYTPGQVTDDNPDGALRYVVLEGGKLYLRGYVPTRKVADQIVAMSAAFSGPGNVVDEQLVDPAVPLETPTAVYVRDVVLFDLNSTTLRPEQYPLVDSGLIFLQSNPNLTITVIGRTDATGSAEVNQQIGLARARAIVDRLVSQGANPAQLIAESRGETDATPSAAPVAEDRFAQIIVNGSLS